MTRGRSTAASRSGREREDDERRCGGAGQLGWSRSSGEAGSGAPNNRHSCGPRSWSRGSPTHQRARRSYVKDPLPQEHDAHAGAVHRRAHRLQPGALEDLQQERRRLPQGSLGRCIRGGRHGRVRRRLGAPALRLVEPRPRRPQDNRLQHLGRSLRLHVHLQASAAREDRGGCRHRSGGQERQGKGARAGARDRGKGVLAKAFDQSITAIEARNNGVPAS